MQTCIHARCFTAHAGTRAPMPVCLCTSTCSWTCTYIDCRREDVATCVSVIWGFG